MSDKTTKSNTGKVVKASARDLRISPRKMRLVTNLIQGKQVSDALVQLQFTNKKAAPMLVKLLKSAIANAEHNFSFDPEQLYVKSLTCDMGKTMKRYFPRARGSAFVIRRKMAHVNLVLEVKAGTTKKRSRFQILSRVRKTETPKSEVIDAVPVETPGHEAAAEKKNVRKISRVKTDEQTKASTVQQKRRLFNRKNGE